MKENLLDKEKDSSSAITLIATNYNNNNIAAISRCKFKMGNKWNNISCRKCK